MDISRIAVIGAGTMGSGIAQVAAQAGYSVVMRDVQESFIARGMAGITSSLDRFVKKGTIKPEEKEAALGRIRATLDIGEAAGCQLVIEAVTEDLAQKKQVFGALGAVASPEAVFATNTSSLSVTEMAQASGRPERFIGMHFFNPVPLMKLVEVIRTPRTSEEAYEVGFEVARRMGKEPIAAKDTPGFVFNRIIIPYLNEAVWALHEGVGSAQDIDTAMKLGGNMPIGPLSLIDLIGLDVHLLVSEVFVAETGDPKFRPCPLLKQMVRAGYLGKKAGKGFFEYPAR